MNLIREAADIFNGPVKPDGWNIGHLPNNGILLSCDGFSAKFDIEQLNLLFDIAESGKAGEVKDSQGDVIYVEPDGKVIILTRENDKNYPNGVILDGKTLKLLGIEEHEEQPENDTDADGSDDTMKVSEGIKSAYRRSGKKIKRGFRVTSGFRKGRVVASAKAAFKPKAPARTRAKLRIAARKKKIIRILKSKRTRKKSLSKRLVRMNKLKK